MIRIAIGVVGDRVVQNSKWEKLTILEKSLAILEIDKLKLKLLQIENE